MDGRPPHKIFASYTLAYINNAYLCGEIRNCARSVQDHIAKVDARHTEIHFQQDFRMYNEAKVV